MADIAFSAQSENANPLGMEGIEFIEYATARPDVFGLVIEKMGFKRVAKHRSRQVFLYRQGDMNLIVNADAGAWVGTNVADSEVVLSAVAFRVADATAAYNRLIELGAWAIPTRAGAMELNIPGIHGVADSILYLVERHRDFSIYDVDFIYDDIAASKPSAVAGMHYFGIVQYVGAGRINEWIDYYQQLFGFSLLPYGQSFGVLPNGILLQSPCGGFYLQLVGPPDDAAYDLEWEERFERLAFGTPDVLATVQALRYRGIEFQEHGLVAIAKNGALTQTLSGGTRFELVLSPKQASGS